MACTLVDNIYEDCKDLGLSRDEVADSRTIAWVERLDAWCLGHLNVMRACFVGDAGDVEVVLQSKETARRVTLRLEEFMVCATRIDEHMGATRCYGDMTNTVSLAEWVLGDAYAAQG